MHPICWIAFASRLLQRVTARLFEHSPSLCRRSKFAAFSFTCCTELSLERSSILSSSLVLYLKLSNEITKGRVIQIQNSNSDGSMQTFWLLRDTGSYNQQQCKYKHECNQRRITFLQLPWYNLDSRLVHLTDGRSGGCRGCPWRDQVNNHRTDQHYITQRRAAHARGEAWCGEGRPR